MCIGRTRGSVVSSRSFGGSPGGLFGLLHLVLVPIYVDKVFKVGELDVHVARVFAIVHEYVDTCDRRFEMLKEQAEHLVNGIRGGK